MNLGRMFKTERPELAAPIKAVKFAHVHIQDRPDMEATTE